MPTVLSVKQLNAFVKSLLDGETRLNYITVRGEISNFKNHYSSGHLYFSLKDSDAVIKSVMFRTYADNLNFVPEDGMCVQCSGKVSVYEKDGQYQLYVEKIVPDGIGEKYILLEQLKAKLQSEGVFSTENKLPIPKIPKRIAVVTSDTGAAVQDVLNILSRRWPLCSVILCPVLVQGDGAVASILTALKRIEKLNNIDLLILGRGGGSIEDLWAFNDEQIARAVNRINIPVISAVGHETDFTLCDFASDLRAPTPSAAAELAVPDIIEVQADILQYSIRMRNALESLINNCSARFNNVIQSKYLLDYNSVFESRALELDNLYDRNLNAFSNILNKSNSVFGELHSKFSAFNPLAVLNRGYSVVTKNGVAVKNIQALSLGDSINIKFATGNADCTVNNISEN